MKWDRPSCILSKRTGDGLIPQCYWAGSITFQPVAFCLKCIQESLSLIEHAQKMYQLEVPENSFIPLASWGPIRGKRLVSNHHTIVYGCQHTWGYGLSRLWRISGAADHLPVGQSSMWLRWHDDVVTLCSPWRDLSISRWTSSSVASVKNKSVTLVKIIPCLSL